MDEEREISDGRYFEIDYTATAFTAHFCMQGKLCPASFMREATSDGSEPIFTDRFMVSLLHPEIGTVTFYLIFVDHSWQFDGDIPLIGGELLEWCDEKIRQHDF